MSDIGKELVAVQEVCRQSNLRAKAAEEARNAATHALHRAADARNAAEARLAECVREVSEWYWCQTRPWLFAILNKYASATPERPEHPDTVRLRQCVRDLGNALDPDFRYDLRFRAVHTKYTSATPERPEQQDKPDEADIPEPVDAWACRNAPAGPEYWDEERGCWTRDLQ